jgi:hypothetical protein
VARQVVGPDRYTSFSASTGAALVSAGFTNAGLIIGAIGAGGIYSSITDQRSISR